MPDLEKGGSSEEPWALVTGSAGAIGRDVCSRLRRHAIRVIGVDKRPDDTAPLGEHLCLDLTDEATIPAIQEVITKFGAPRYLVGAAGTYLRRPFLEYQRSEMELTISENFLATAVVVQLVLDAMVKAGGGRIVLVTSQASTAGGTDALYAAAKAGLVALVKSVAREFSRFGVLCNAVSPGPVDTPMATVMGPELRRDYEHRIPIGRFASPSEVGEVIVFLLMMEGGAISGATIDVDGGLIRR